GGHAGEPLPHGGQLQQLRAPRVHHAQRNARCGRGDAPRLPTTGLNVLIQGGMDMKRSLCGAVAAVALVGGVAPAVAFACAGGTKGPTPKVTFCHHTSSETNPYVKITTA